MTIAAVYHVSDGIVFGADSSSTIEIKNAGGRGVLQVLNHSQKVFEIGKESRIGLCTWGAASLGKISHRTLVAQLSDKIDDNKTTIAEASDILLSIALPFIGENKIQYVGYNIGGWDRENHIPSAFNIEIKAGVPSVNPVPLGGCVFSGQHSFFGRVFRGYDSILPKNLLQELKGQCSAIPDFDNIFMAAFEKVTLPLATVGFQDLPIREAIDFVNLYLHLTIKAYKFKFGAPICGGPIEIGFISSDRRFRWVRHKTFESALVEQEGEYEFE